MKSLDGRVTSLQRLTSEMARVKRTSRRSNQTMMQRALETLVNRIENTRPDRIPEKENIANHAESARTTIIEEASSTAIAAAAVGDFAVTRIVRAGPGIHPEHGPVPYAFQVEWAQSLVLPENLSSDLAPEEFGPLPTDLQWSDCGDDTIARRNQQIKKRGYQDTFICRFCKAISPENPLVFTRRDNCIRHERKCVAPGGPCHKCYNCPTECPGQKDYVPPPATIPGPKKR